MSSISANPNAILKPYKGSHMKNKEKQSASMVETLGAAGAGIGLAIPKVDKTNPNNKSVAIASIDMSKILPQIEEEQKESSHYGSSMSINAEVRGAERSSSGHNGYDDEFHISSQPKDEEKGFNDSDNEEMYTKTPNAKNPYLYSGRRSPNSGPGSAFSKNTGSRKPSVQPVVQFNIPNLNLDQRNLTIKDTDTDSEYTYNPRALGHNMNSMLSRKQTSNGNESGFINHNTSAISARHFTAGNQSLVNNTRVTYVSQNDSQNGPLLTKESDQTDIHDQFMFGKRTYDAQLQFEKGIHNYAEIPDKDISHESDFISGRDRCKQIMIKYTLILWFSVLAVLKANSVHEFIAVPQYPQKDRVDAFIGGWWFWFALLPPVNVWLTLVLGRYILAMTLFPYQNACMRETMDRTNALKFGQEFTHYLQSFAFTLRINADMERPKAKKQNPKSVLSQKAENEEEESDTDSDDAEYLTYTEMKNTIDLLTLYISVNTQVRKEKATLPMFGIFTEIMKRLEVILRRIKVKNSNKQGPMQNITLWEYFQDSTKSSSAATSATTSPREGTFIQGNQPGGAPAPKSGQTAAARRLPIPLVLKTKENVQSLDMLEIEIEKFNKMVYQSGRTKNTICRILMYYLCCCKCIFFRNRCRRLMNSKIYPSSLDTLFGDLLQQSLIMNKNFGGTQFLIPSVPGRNQPKLDCMFFPATHGDHVELDPVDAYAPVPRLGSRVPTGVRTSNSASRASSRLDTSSSGGQSFHKQVTGFHSQSNSLYNKDQIGQTVIFQSSAQKKKYLYKPTIIISNPNAMVYQWMVTSSNAYWLDFFLRRECNVLIWNYRGYGDSEQSIFSPNYTVTQEKVDSERIVQFLINRLKVKGQIGVYGRSIGGIAATHQAAKFSDIIQVVFTDRTLGRFTDAVNMRFPRSRFTQMLARWWMDYAHVDNSEGMTKNGNSYKILTSDDQDDVFDSFSQLPMAVALRHKTRDYRNKDWQEFYKTLVFIFDLERTLYDQHKEEADGGAGGATVESTPIQSPANGIPRCFSTASLDNQDILKSIDIAEEQLQSSFDISSTMPDFALEGGKPKSLQASPKQNSRKKQHTMEHQKAPNKDELRDERFQYSETLMNSERDGLLKREKAEAPSNKRKLSTNLSKMKRDSVQITGRTDGTDPLLRSTLSLGFIIKTIKERKKSETIDNPQGQDLTQAILNKGKVPKMSLFKLMHQLILLLSDFDAGCMNIQRVVGYQHRHDFQMFVKFLKILEVYGCGYDDDVDSKLYKKREKYSHCQEAQKELKDIIKIYEIAIEQLNDERFSLSSQRYSKISSNTLKQQFKLLFEFQKKMFIKLFEIQSEIGAQQHPSKEDFEPKPQGHLVKMFCGHRGIPYRCEEKRISRLLRKSGFIPQLETSEEIQRKKYIQTQNQEHESQIVITQQMLAGNVYGVPQTPIKQEFNANRMAAKKEIQTASTQPHDYSRSTLANGRVPFPVFDNDSNSD